jgi:hypothetical protein
LPSSATPAVKTADVVEACAAAADDLAKTRAYTAAMEAENGALRERLDTERKLTRTLAEINDTRRSESEALRSAADAYRDAAAAGRAVIESQQKLIETLKHKKTSPLKRIADIMIGAAIFAILK